MNVKDLFQVADKIESYGYSFYSDLSKHVSGKTVDLFQDLAKQEREHREKFKQIYSRYSGKKSGANTWEEQEVSGYLKSLANLSIFPSMEKEEVPSDYQAALDMAIDSEKDSIILYNDIEYLVKEEEPIRAIIDEEKKHMETLLEEKERSQ